MIGVQIHQQMKQNTATARVNEIKQTQQCKIKLKQSKMKRTQTNKQ